MTLNFDDYKSRLLVANVPRQAASKFACDPEDKTIEIKQEVAPNTDASYRYQSMSLAEVNVIELANDSARVSGHQCHRGVCCSVEVTFDHDRIDQCNVNERFMLDKSAATKWKALTKALFSLALDESYHLLVSNRTRPGVYPWAEELCALVYCLPDQNPPCRQVRTGKQLATRFRTIKLTAEVGQHTRVYPSVVGSKHALIQPDQGRTWTFTKVKGQKSGGTGRQTYQLEVNPKQGKGSLALSTVALYGRAYERDPPYKQRPTGL